MKKLTRAAILAASAIALMTSTSAFANTQLDTAKKSAVTTTAMQDQPASYVGTVTTNCPSIDDQQASAMQGFGGTMMFVEQQPAYSYAVMTRDLSAASDQLDQNQGARQFDLNTASRSYATTAPRFLGTAFDEMNVTTI